MFYGTSIAKVIRADARRRQFQIIPRVHKDEKADRITRNKITVKHYTARHSIHF